MALDTEKIIEELKGASILELNDLVKAIEEEFVMGCLHQARQTC